MIDKSETLSYFHDRLNEKLPLIKASKYSQQQKAKIVNGVVADTKSTVLDKIEDLPSEERATGALIVQYCSTVASLEYRHRVWPYEYMAFSRRVGELWEAFCKTAWDYPANNDLERFNAPEFDDLRSNLENSLQERLRDHPDSPNLMIDIQSIFELIGEINMHEDEIFYRGDTPNVIDFKSGFGSNEKGNTLRLLAVGRAYHLWNPDTKLMLLVRQEVNNNYLKVLERSNIWEVFTGDQTYEVIEEITGADIQHVRQNIIEWRADLSKEFYRHISESENNLLSYLKW